MFFFLNLMVNLNIQQPLLQSSVSQDPSEIILICWFAEAITLKLFLLMPKILNSSVQS